MAGEHNTWGEFPLGQAEYDIPFDYLARRFVKLSFRLSTNPSLITELTVVDDFEFVTATRIRLLKVAEQGEDMLMIQRVTDTTRVVDFKDGSVLTGANLNVSQVQSIHIAEEARDVITAELDATLKTVTDLLEEAKNAADSAKESIKHVDEISADFESKRSKMLRVGDRNISQFANAAQRANRLVGFEQTGDAALIVPDPNSGISLGLALADKSNPGGAALVGHDGSTVGEILQGMRGLSMTRVTELGQGYANWPQGKMAQLNGKTYMGFNYGAQHGGTTLHAYIIGTTDGTQFDAPILVAAPTATEEATAWSLVEVGGSLYTIVRFRIGTDAGTIRHVIYKSTTGASGWQPVTELTWKSEDNLSPVLYHHGMLLKDGRVVFGWHDSVGNLGYALMNMETLNMEHHVLRTKAQNTTSNGTVKQAEPTFFMRPDTGECLIITRAQAGWRTESPQIWKASADFSTISSSYDSGIPVDVNPVSAVISPGGANVLFFYSERYTTTEKRAGLFVMETPLEDAFSLEFSRSKHRRLVDLNGDSKASAAVAGVQQAIRLGNRVLIGVASRSDNNVNRSDVYMVTLSWDDNPLLPGTPSNLSGSNTRNYVEQGYWGMGLYAPRIRMNGQSVLSWGPDNVEIGTYGSGMGERGIGIYSYDGTGRKTPAIYVRPYNLSYGDNTGHVDINRDLRMLQPNGSMHLGIGYRIRIGGTTAEQGQSMIYHNAVDNTLEIGSTTDKGLPFKVWSYSPFGLEFRRAGAPGASINLTLTDSSGVKNTITGGGSVGGVSLSTPSVPQALHVRDTGNTVLKGSLGLANFTVAQLSDVTATRGSVVFVTDGRGPRQEAGGGSGVPAYFSGAGWLTFYDSKPVQA